MTGEFITLKELLAWMDSGEQFSILFITYTRKTKEGGRRIFVKEAIKSNYISHEERKEQERLYGKKKLKRNPNHFKNSTRNITVVPSGNIITIHIRLIRKFNNRTVI